MNGELHVTGDAIRMPHGHESHRPFRRLASFWREWQRFEVPAMAALLALSSFSLTGREAPESASGLDLIAVTKFAIRMLVVFWFGIQIMLTAYLQLQRLVARRQTNLATFLLRFQWTSPVLVPWIAFACWSLLTVAWSPLKATSAGQWLGLLALLVFAQVIFMRYKFVPEIPQSLNQQGRSDDFSWIVLVRQLCFVLLIYCLIVLCVHLAMPQQSGLDRTFNYRGTNRFVHPTAAGATSSLGLAFAAVLLSRHGLKQQLWLLPAIAIHAAVLFISSSRASLAMAVFVIMFCVSVLVGMRIRGSIQLALGVLLMSIVLVDPSFELIGDAIGGTAKYVQRGQTSAQLQEVSGRKEMWAAVWKEFEKSPIVGHGYFVTSERGKLDVWGVSANHDAHNIVLQTLVATGVIGAMLFAWALLVSAIKLVRLFVSNPPHSQGRELSWLLLVIGLWYLGWCQGCVSFLGAIRPESVMFFAMLGLLAAATHVESGQRFSRRKAGAP